MIIIGGIIYSFVITTLNYHDYTCLLVYMLNYTIEMVSWSHYEGSSLGGWVCWLVSATGTAWKQNVHRVLYL